MRKRYCMLFVSIFLLLSLNGCKNSGNPKWNPHFDATVLEVDENMILVEPFENEKIQKSSDKISVSTDVISTISVPDLEIGTEIRVVYNGDILETDPARIKNVFAIYLLDENGEILYMDHD